VTKQSEPDLKYWKLRRNKTLVATWPDATSYAIDLDRARTGTQACDWIAQLRGKIWITRPALVELATFLQSRIGLSCHCVKLALTSNDGSGLDARVKSPHVVEQPKASSPRRGSSSSASAATTTRTANKQPMVAAQPGMLVKARVDGMVKNVKVVKIDENEFPGKVIVKDEQGKEHAIAIEIGWPDR
jgi:hypothetical protein